MNSRDLPGLRNRHPCGRIFLAVGAPEGPGADSVGESIAPDLSLLAARPCTRQDHHRRSRRRARATGSKRADSTVHFAANPRRAEGLSSSVRRGIAQARYSPALLLLPVDLAALQYA